MGELIFLKLGGSLITDKTKFESVREDVLARLAREIAEARERKPELRFVLGHGSGCFGHMAAAKYDTRQGVKTAHQWRGFAKVSDAAARLNKIVRAALLEAGIPAITYQPSASAVCEDGRLHTLAIEPITAALDAGLLPVIYGDVAIDQQRGGTIISTEEIMAYLADHLQPDWFLLGGETTGVYDTEKRTLPLITRHNLPHIETALGGSRGTDVTGGMASKVRHMLDLVEAVPGLSIRIFSGLEPGLLCRLLQQPEYESGTLINLQDR